MSYKADKAAPPGSLQGVEGRLLTRDPEEKTPTIEEIRVLKANVEEINLVVQDECAGAALGSPPSFLQRSILRT